MKLEKKTDWMYVLHVTNAFTKETTPQLQKVCEKVIADKNITAILLDFRKVTSIDTSAFACMISFMEKHKHSKIKVGILHPKHKEKAFMDMLKIRKMVHVFKSETEAIKLLSSM